MIRLFRRRPTGDTLGKKMRYLEVAGLHLYPKQEDTGWSVLVATMEIARAIEPFGFVVEVSEPTEVREAMSTPTPTPTPTPSRDVEPVKPPSGWAAWREWLEAHRTDEQPLHDFHAARAVQRAPLELAAEKKRRKTAPGVVVLVVTGWGPREASAIERAVKADVGKVILVQNDPDAIMPEDMDVDVVVRTPNHGFGAACDAGAEEAPKSAKWILFTQADVEWTADAVRDAVGLSERAGGALVGPSGGTVEDGCGVTEIGRNASKGRPDVQPVDFVAGYWLVVPSSVLRAAGGWGSWAFLYFEDPDLSLRCALLGHRSVIDPRLEVDHARGKTIEHVVGKEEREEVRAWSQQQFHRRWLSDG